MYLIITITICSLLLNESAFSLEQTCSKPMPPRVPATGFILANLYLNNGEPVQRVIQVKSKMSIITSCSRIVFKNAPAFLGASIFHIIEGKLANARAYYSNSKYFLSFVKDSYDRPYGIWIIGDTPGVDSGVGYIAAPYPSLVPIFDNATATSWNWMLDSQWNSQMSTELICSHSTTNAMIFDGSYSELSELHTISILVLDNSTCAYNNGLSQDWLPLTFNDSSAVAMGTRVMVSDGIGGGCIGYLVNGEYLYDYWRLMFHCHNVDMAEVFISYGDQGVIDGGMISYLEETEQAEQMSSLTSQLSASKIGDFYWFWYTSMTGEVIKPLLAQCTATLGSTIIFKYYHDDRRDVMSRSFLSYIKDVIVVSVLNSTAMSMTVDDESVTLISAPYLTGDIINWTKQYLLRNEGRFGGLSSCFLYHAAIAMPHPLVYLAELVCVLMGSKPITMIQFSSKSDQQWKFPLIPYLTEKVLTTVRLHENFDLDYHINTYHEDVTLIIFNKNQRRLAESLKPYKGAQALHIAPYPENSPGNVSENKRIYEQQVYNSWWNGLVLGYPQHVVEHYCLDLYVELSQEERLHQMALAKKEVYAFMEINKLSPAPIHLGLNQDVGDVFWNM